MKTVEWKNYSRRLQSLAAVDFNYDVKTFEASRNGWFIDKHKVLLCRELPGPPLADGPFQRVRECIRLYQFPDPRLITAIFDPGSELSGRNMLLRARFAGLTFYFGVRVTAVIDEVRKDAHGHHHQTWGYAYRTLKGHFEIGEIRFLASKDTTTGEIFFEIDAYSKPDRIPNPIYRIGFKIFGRPLQRYFARSSIRRLKERANTNEV